jgi:hypothetical protein
MVHSWRRPAGGAGPSGGRGPRRCRRRRRRPQEPRVRIVLHHRPSRGVFCVSIRHALVQAGHRQPQACRFCPAPTLLAASSATRTASLRRSSRRQQRPRPVGKNGQCVFRAPRGAAAGASRVPRGPAGAPRGRHPAGPGLVAVSRPRLVGGSEPEADDDAADVVVAAAVVRLLREAARGALRVVQPLHQADRLLRQGGAGGG